jgi:hypothetical protein
MRRRLDFGRSARRVLAPLLAALLLAASFAPCTAFVGTAAAASDPCKPHKAAPPPTACIQLACQSVITPAPIGDMPEPAAFGQVVLITATAAPVGRSDAPEPPPPKSAPAIRA